MNLAHHTWWSDTFLAFKDLEYDWTVDVALTQDSHVHFEGFPADVGRIFGVVTFMQRYDLSGVHGGATKD